MTIRQYPTEWRRGQWKATCDRCGFDYHSNALRLEWTGLRVCGECFDMRHPLDYMQGKPDRQTPDWTRPDNQPRVGDWWILYNGFWNDNGKWVDSDIWRDYPVEVTQDDL